jgi:hypothetical protein
LVATVIGCAAFAVLVLDAAAVAPVYPDIVRRRRKQR